MVWGGFSVDRLSLSSSESNCKYFNIKTFWTISHTQHCNNSLRIFSSCSDMTVPVGKARRRKTSRRWFEVEGLDWPAQTPEINLIEHLWKKIEWRLSQVSGRIVKNSHKHTPNLIEFLSRRVESIIVVAKGVPSHIKPS